MVEQTAITVAERQQHGRSFVRLCSRVLLARPRPALSGPTHFATVTTRAAMSSPPPFSFPDNQKGQRGARSHR